MKTANLILTNVTAAILLAAPPSQAGVLDIPDGNPTGVASTVNVSGYGSSISGLTVSLNFTGGNNGDLYAYLSYDGHLVNLLDQPGVASDNPVGYTGAGLDVTLSDGSYNNINTYSEPSGTQVTGTYNAAGGSAAFGNAYNGVNPNGTWTLFVSDMSGGDAGDSQLVSWDVNITAVPEPINVALTAFAAIFAGVGLWRFRRSRRPCA
jgi:subtilisin-like proprotein convertase family protein